MVYALDPDNSVIKRFWCINLFQLSEKEDLIGYHYLSFHGKKKNLSFHGKKKKKKKKDKYEYLDTFISGMLPHDGCIYSS